MTRKVVKRLEALIAIDEIAERIARDDADAAMRFIDAAEESCDFLARFPISGELIRTRLKRLKGLRAWQVKGFRNYVILYRATETEIEILTVFHGARNLPRVLRGL